MRNASSAIRLPRSMKKDMATQWPPERHCKQHCATPATPATSCIVHHRCLCHILQIMPSCSRNVPALVGYAPRVVYNGRVPRCKQSTGSTHVAASPQADATCAPDHAQHVSECQSSHRCPTTQHISLYNHKLEGLLPMQLAAQAPPSMLSKGQAACRAAACTAAAAALKIVTGMRCHGRG
jgi:hypothetical protein